MKVSTRLATKFLMALTLASSLSMVLVKSARADEHFDRRRAEIDRHRIEEARHFHDHHPVYAPAPVVYTPPPSPGISIVLPIEIR